MKQSDFNRLGKGKPHKLFLVPGVPITVFIYDDIANDVRYEVYEVEGLYRCDRGFTGHFGEWHAIQDEA